MTSMFVFFLFLVFVLIFPRGLRLVLRWERTWSVAIHCTWVPSTNGAPPAHHGSS